MYRVLIVTERDKWHKFETFTSPDIEKTMVEPDELLLEDMQSNPYDIVFLRTKNELFLKGLIKKSPSRLILNAPQASLLAIERYHAIEAIKKNGVLVPQHYLAGDCAVGDVVVKNRVDTTENKPRLLSGLEWRQYADENINAYAQQYIPAKWEYKLYLFGGRSWLFRQVPTMINPDKLSTREALPDNRMLFEQARKAADAVGLLFASVDFLEYEGRFYLTDINATPGFQNLAGGYKNIISSLKEVADRYREAL